MKYVSILAVVFLISACESDSKPETTPQEEEVVTEDPNCNPLVPTVCNLPFPSMTNVISDDTSPTGYRVNLVADTLPVALKIAPTYINWINTGDGFSTGAPFTALFDDDFIDSATLPTVFNLSESLDATSAVQLFDLETNQRLPAWGEIDSRGQSPSETPLIIHPMVAANFGSRILVVVTDSLRYNNGTTPQPSPVFAALRDKTDSKSPFVEANRARYEELFTFLTDAGLQREKILLAWEVVIQSQDHAQGRLLKSVAAAKAALEEATPTYSITRCISSAVSDQQTLGCDAQEDEDTPLGPYTWRRIYGTIQLPKILDDDGNLQYEADGSIKLHGTRETDFMAHVPTSLKLAAAGSAQFLSFGHGFQVGPDYYLSDDINRNGELQLGDRLGAVYVGTRYLGLSDTEVQAAAGVIADANTAPAFSNLLIQGVVNQVMIAPFVRAALTHDDLLRAADFSGPLISSEPTVYKGVSLGGIFGTTLMAVSPYITTAVLHVPSAVFSTVMPHSPDFEIFRVFLNSTIPSFTNQAIYFALAQNVFDPTDPINYIRNLKQDTLTPLGVKNLLWQCGLGDMSAPWYNCEMMMRSGGFPQAGPTFRDIYGVETIDTPTASYTSALQYFDPQLGIPPTDLDKVERPGVHAALRRNDEVQLQVVDYLNSETPGKIVNHCGGPCVIVPVPEPEQ